MQHVLNGNEVNTPKTAGSTAKGEPAPKPAERNAGSLLLTGFRLSAFE